MRQTIANFIAFYDSMGVPALNPATGYVETGQRTDDALDAERAARKRQWYLMQHRGSYGRISSRGEGRAKAPFTTGLHRLPGSGAAL